MSDRRKELEIEVEKAKREFWLCSRNLIGSLEEHKRNAGKLTDNFFKDIGILAQKHEQILRNFEEESQKRMKETKQLVKETTKLRKREKKMETKEADLERKCRDLSQKNRLLRKRIGDKLKKIKDYQTEISLIREKLSE